MKKHIATYLLWAMALGQVLGQGKYLGNEGTISFFSKAPLEDIEAIHEEVSGVINGESGEVAFIVKMTGFQFEKKLMQEHFNENYVESEKYPKSTFEGMITNNAEVDYTKAGSYPVTVKGNLTIHGVGQDIEVPGEIEVKGKGIIARTTFIVKPADHDIKIPKVVRNNIAKEVEVKVQLQANPI
jgi:hypothetical protein